jgi:hypothetical protein
MLAKAKRLLLVGLVVCVSAWSNACVSTYTPTIRVILVPDGEPVQLAEDVTAHVWCHGEGGELVRSSNYVRIPAGWWCLPDPGPEDGG